MSKIIKAAKIPEILPWLTDSDRTPQFQCWSEVVCAPIVGWGGVWTPILRAPRLRLIPSTDTILG